jgi:probable F420-dependent oxidoreductase
MEVATRFAVLAPVGGGVTGDPGWMAAFARHLEACGFESIVVVEHTVLASRYDSVYPYDRSGRVELAADCPVPDPLDLLAFLAGHTKRLGLATGVLVLPNHHPVVLAKRAATVDTLSGGWLRLCVGVGWLREEIEACGTAFDTRGRRADEQLEVLRALWDDRPRGVSHHASSSTSTTSCATRNPLRAKTFRCTSVATAGRRRDGPDGLATAFSRSGSPVHSWTRCWR